MSFRLTRSESGRPQVILEGEPSYCRALDAAPGAREPELDLGRWLVVAFPAWSVPDVQQVETALEVVKRLDGPLQLGIRPFDDAEELQAWLPEASITAPTPIWVFLAQGTVTGVHNGAVEAAELVKLIERAVVTPDGMR